MTLLVTTEIYFIYKIYKSLLKNNNAIFMIKNLYGKYFAYSYIMSGDADGKCYIWDWKTTKLYKKWKAHDNVCIGVLWHPHEPSKVATAGWDGLIKYWD